MKTILTIGVVTLSSIAIGQTNRVFHYSHSGSKSTYGIFKTNDNLGLGCGAAFQQEYMPDTNEVQLKVCSDTSKLDTSKIKKPLPINGKTPFALPKAPEKKEVVPQPKKKPVKSAMRYQPTKLSSPYRAFVKPN